MAGAGGGAWKVAYADFVTAMMAFFMVMWLTTQKEGVKEAVAGYFRDPFATFKSTEKGAAATAQPITDPMYGHTSQPQKRPLPISGDNTDYQFTVVFPSDDATIEPAQLEYIKNFAPMMVGKLNRIEVRGHCLRRPLPEGSPYTDHWQLCYARCQAVKKELEKLGIERERIRLSQAEGNEPLALNLTPEELSLNSRVDVILLPDLADLAWERPQTEKAPAATPESEDSINVGLNAQPAEPKEKAKHGEKKEHGEETEHAEKTEHTEKAEHGEAKEEHASEKHVDKEPANASAAEEKAVSSEHSQAGEAKTAETADPRAESEIPLPADAMGPEAEH
jgi:chemotaxis protein MotB